MATIKSYTDIEQSKKLAEILPIESADMSYCAIHNIGQETHHCNIPIFVHATNTDIPCWSLAALLNVVRKTIGYIIYGINNVYISCERSDSRKIETNIYDNEVDACVAMVIKLSKLKLL